MITLFGKNLIVSPHFCTLATFLLLKNQQILGSTFYPVEWHFTVKKVALYNAENDACRFSKLNRRFMMNKPTVCGE